MKNKCTFGLIAMGCVVILATTVFANTAKQNYAQGKAQLAKGDFQAALESFAAAARTDRNNPDYLKQYRIVHQIITMRKRFDVERDSAKWQRIALTLHKFYLDEKAYDEALALDKKVHARLANGLSATLLAQTQMAMNRHAEAVDTIASLPPDQKNWMTQAVHVIALARDGRVEAARRAADAIKMPAQLCTGKSYMFAQMNAVIGREEQAIGLLKQCLESTAPSRLEAFKAQVKSCPEFAGLLKSEAFIAAMQTKSKVAESSCSGGSSCAGCPNRGKCSKAAQ